MLRMRLLEVYDRELVDQMLPYKPEDFIQFDEKGQSMYTIHDSEE